MYTKLEIIKKMWFNKPSSDLLRHLYLALWLSPLGNIVWHANMLGVNDMNIREVDQVLSSVDLLEV